MKGFFQANRVRKRTIGGYKQGLVITGQNQGKKVMVLEWKEHGTIEDSWALSLWKLLESKSCHLLSGIWLFLDWSLKLKKAGPSFLKDHRSFSPLLFRILANCSLTLSLTLLLEFYVFSKSMWNTNRDVNSSVHWALITPNCYFTCLWYCSVPKTIQIWNF